MKIFIYGSGFRIWNKGDVQMVSSITLLSIHHLLLTKKDWKHKVELEDCIKSMYKWYLEIMVKKLYE